MKEQDLGSVLPPFPLFLFSLPVHPKRLISPRRHFHALPTASWISSGFISSISPSPGLALAPKPQVIPVPFYFSRAGLILVSASSPVPNTLQQSSPSAFCISLIKALSSQTNQSSLIHWTKLSSCLLIPVPSFSSSLVSLGILLWSLHTPLWL